MADYVDKRLFADLASADPQQVISADCRYLKDEKNYSVNVWGEQYVVSPLGETITLTEIIAEHHDMMFVFVVNYLLAEKKSSPQGEWISEKDLVGGVTFFRGPHEVPTHYITQVFGDNLVHFRRSCENLGGTPIDMADVAFAFPLVDSIQAALLYWHGDEDFPAACKVLLDSSVNHLALDIIYALLTGICLRVGKSG